MAINQRNAFTIIELLVVIAIISILAAVLFPVFTAAREKARQTQCSSNLKQLGMAVIQYAQDFDEIMPPVLSRSCIPDASFIMGPPKWLAGQNTSCQLMTPSSPAGYDHPGWVEAIYPYVKTKNVFKCPDDAAASQVYDSNNQNTTIQSSYGINVFLGGYPAGTAGTYTQNVLNWGKGDTTGQCTGWNSAYCGDVGFPSSKINRPSDIVLITEYGKCIDTTAGTGGYKQIRGDYYMTPYWDASGTYNYVDNVSGTFCVYGNCSVGGSTIYVLPEHLNSTNFLFIDGHVKSEIVQGIETGPPTVSSTWLPAQGDLKTNTVLDEHWHASAL